ncbi:hypothetical protein EW026_g1442 [Hermanssonia centrifuga]|uniref:Uncharacterized protein n=1 Tax=Hermanssonia centrifuga TaxID=98765 RepID=A0A4S4KRG3_9APHY|nr:hypothetical protein EW026_g1442 [Hermanssonia centrifuga]
MSSRIPAPDGTVDDLHYSIVKNSDDGKLSHSTHYIAYRDAIILPAASGAYEGPQHILPILITDGDGAAPCTTIYGENLYFKAGATYNFKSKILKIVAKSINVFGEGVVTFDLHGDDGETSTEDIKPAASGRDGTEDTPSENGSDGTKGHDGGNGVAGGSFSLLASSVIGAFIVNLKGGNGSAGRKGGTGGNGGHGCKTNRSYINTNKTNYTLEELQARYRGSKGGRGGTGGNGGNGAVGGNFIAVLPNHCRTLLNVSQDDGSAGAAGEEGDAGKGGEAGECVIGRNGLKSSWRRRMYANAGDQGDAGSRGSAGNAPDSSQKQTILTDFVAQVHVPTAFPPDFLQLICDRLRFEYHILSAVMDLNTPSTDPDARLVKFDETLAWLLLACPAIPAPPVDPNVNVEGGILSDLRSNVRQSILNLKYCINLRTDIWGRRLDSIDSLFFPFYGIKEKLRSARHVEEEYLASKKLNGEINKDRYEKANTFASLVQNEKTLKDKITEAGLRCQELVENITRAKTVVEDKTRDIDTQLRKAEKKIEGHVEWNGWGALLALGTVVVAPEAGLVAGAVTVLEGADLDFNGITTGGGDKVQKSYVLRKMTHVQGGISEIRDKMKDLFKGMGEGGGEGLEMITVDKDKFTELCDEYLEAIGADGPLRMLFQDLQTQSDVLNNIILSYNTEVVQLHKLASDRAQAKLQQQVLQIVPSQEDEDYRRLHLLRYFYSSTYTKHKMALVKEIASAAAGVRALTFINPDYLASWMDFGCFGAVTVDCLIEAWEVLRTAIEDYQRVESMNKTQEVPFTARIDTVYPFVVDNLKKNRSFIVDLLPKAAANAHWISSIWRDVRLQGLQVFLEGAKHKHPSDHAQISLRVRSLNAFVVHDTMGRKYVVNCPEVISPFAYLAKDRTAACKPVNPNSAQFQLDDPKNTEPMRRCLISPYTTWIVEVDGDVDLSEVNGVTMVFTTQARSTQGKVDSV